jgi:uncharacterized protein GlcG (DUF336 family)
MNTITLEQAQTIVRATLAYAREHDFEPTGVAVLDVRGALTAFATEDGSTLGRAQVVMGKASGCISMGVGGRSLARRGAEAPQWTLAVGNVLPLGLLPGIGGVLVRDAAGKPVGAVGVAGAAPENDEAAAIAGITAAGLVADPGSSEPRRK